jgi:hypothetical protein
MSNDLAVSMAELEGESAELLPSRETLTVCRSGSHSSSSTSYSYTDNDFNPQFGLVNLNQSSVDISILNLG